MISVLMMEAVLLVTGGMDPSRLTAAELTAQQIVARMGRVYRSARSYQDSGVVTETFSRPGMVHSTTKPFKTAFVRPNLFYYQFTEKRDAQPERKYVVWADGKKIRSWWTVRPDVKEFDAIGPSLSGPLGVSGGSAHTIPRLLLADTMTTTYAITSISAPRLEGSENVGKMPCYRITGGDFLGSPMTQFIGKRDFLVHKIVAEPARYSKKTTLYHPRLNVKIDLKTFRFTPPVVSGRPR